MRRLPLFALVVIVGCGKGTPTTAPVPPAQWGLKELADHLNGKGVKVVVIPLPDLGGDKAQFAYLSKHRDDPPDASVLVVYYPDGKGVAEQVKAMGEGAFAFERFAIGLPRPTPTDEDRALLKRIAEALK